jgi:hypothetical protein
MKKTTFDLGKKWDIDQQADNNLSIWVDQERMNGTLLATVYNEVDDNDETHVAIAELIASAPLMKAYIDYVEGKLDMGEMPLDFEQWQDFEQSITATVGEWAVIHADSGEEVKGNFTSSYEAYQWLEKACAGEELSPCDLDAYYVEKCDC